MVIPVGHFTICKFDHFIIYRGRASPIGWDKSHPLDPVEAVSIHLNGDDCADQKMSSLIFQKDSDNDKDNDTADDKDNYHLR